VSQSPEPRGTRVCWLPGEVAFEVPAGQPLIDAIDEQPRVSLPMACRAANCGTCRVRVVAGASSVIPPDPWEQDTLRIHDAAPGERLGCQLRFKHETGIAQDTEVVLERVS
jgi:ferredoxin